MASCPLVKSLILAGGLLSNLFFTGATSPTDNALKYLKYEGAIVQYPLCLG